MPQKYFCYLIYREVKSGKTRPNSCFCHCFFVIFYMERMYQLKWRSILSAYSLKNDITFVSHSISLFSKTACHPFRLANSTIRLTRIDSEPFIAASNASLYLNFRNFLLIKDSLLNLSSTTKSSLNVKKNSGLVNFLVKLK